MRRWFSNVLWNLDCLANNAMGFGLGCFLLIDRYLEPIGDGCLGFLASFFQSPPCLLDPIQKSINTY